MAGGREVGAKVGTALALLSLCLDGFSVGAWVGMDVGTGLDLKMDGINRSHHGSFDALGEGGGVLLYLPESG